MRRVATHCSRVGTSSALGGESELAASGRRVACEPLIYSALKETVWGRSVGNPADRASCVERCCRLDAVGRKRSQQTASEHPHVIATPPSSRGPDAAPFRPTCRALRCSFCAAIHPGASIHGSFRRGSAGVRCVPVRDLWGANNRIDRPVGREGHGLAGS